jgi:mannose-6-phosphate isomerase-like protein (cupin superfamily)
MTRTSPAAPVPGANSKSAERTGESPGEKEQIAAIERAINRERDAVYECYAMASADDYRVQGSVVLALVIEQSGKAAKVDVLEDSAGNERLKNCLVSLWRGYRWPALFSPGDQIQLPPFEFVAPAAQYTVRTSHVQPRALAGRAGTARPLLHQKNSGNSDAALTLLEIGGEIPTHAHAVSELLYVLAGSGELIGEIAGAKAGALEPGMAVYLAAGVAHRLRSGGKQPLLLLQLIAPAGAEADAQTDTYAAERVKRGGRTARHPQLRATAAGEKFALAGGGGEVIIVIDEKSMPGTPASLNAVTIQPSGAVPRHLHAESSEFLYLLEGSGELTVGSKRLAVRSGDAVQIPRSLEHSFTPAAGPPVKAVQFYAPPGPEQRFRHD